LASVANDVQRINQSVSGLRVGLAQHRVQSDSNQERLISGLQGLSVTAESLSGKLDRSDNSAALSQAAELVPSPPPLSDSAAREPSPVELPSELSVSEGVRMATALAVLADPAPKLEPKNLTKISGWVLRDVYNGNAIIENRQRVLHEVAPGKTVAGLGQVEAIEKQGKRWIVVTDRGIIVHDGTP
jgi:hypothetical protein